jgi:hypothetical protein
MRGIFVMLVHRFKFAGQHLVDKLGWFDAGLIALACVYSNITTSEWAFLIASFILLIHVAVFLHYYGLTTVERLTIGRKMPMGEIPDCPRSMHYVVDFSHQQVFKELNCFQFRGNANALLLPDNTIAVACFEGTSISDIKTVLRSQRNWLYLRRFSDSDLNNSVMGVVTSAGTFQMRYQ